MKKKSVCEEENRQVEAEKDSARGAFVKKRIVGPTGIISNVEFFLIFNYCVFSIDKMYDIIHVFLPN